LTFVKAGPNEQNQVGPIQLFSTNFVLICTTNKNFVVLKKKKRSTASLILAG